MGRSQSSHSQSRGDMQRSPSGHSPQPLQSIREQGGLDGVGMDPNEFLARRAHESSYLAMTSTNLSPTALTQHHHGLSVTPPSLVSGSSALEDSPDMSRQHSSFGNNWPTSTPMINSVSQQSFYGDPAWGESQSFTMREGDDPKSYGSSQDFVGFGGAFPTQENYDSNMFLPLPESVPMDRSGSDTSTSSCRSTASNLESRARERREQVLRNSATLIQPKPQEPGEKVTTKKISVSKSTPARRKHSKVTCPHCDDHPEFRGEHEKNRHIAAKHSKEVTKYVCRDPAKVGLESTVQPKVPLDDCKACKSGKLYGAYYNAGAHLRRWHFNPKGVRGKGKKAEKRGGSAGGYWPEMDDLKVWFEKRVVIEGPTKTKKTEAEAEAEAMDDEMADYEDNVDDAAPMEAELPPFMDNNDSFNMPTTQAPQASRMVTDLNQPTGFQPTGDEMFDFVGYPEATYADNASPFFGSGSSAAFTPSSNFDLWSQDHMGNAFPGSD